MNDGKSAESPATPEDRRNVIPVMATEQAAQWIYSTCRAFGATVATSHKVAGFFAEALDKP